MNPFTPGFNNFNGFNGFPGAFNNTNGFGFPQNFGGSNQWSNWSNGNASPFGWTGFTPTGGSIPAPFWNNTAFNTTPNFNTNNWWMQNAWPTGGWNANTTPWTNGWSNVFAPAMNTPTGFNTAPTPWGGFNPGFNPGWNANWSNSGFPFFAANTTSTTPTPWTNGFFNSPVNNNPFTPGAFNGFNGFNNWNGQNTPSTPWSGAPSWFTTAFGANPFNYNWNIPFGAAPMANFPTPNFTPGFAPGFAPFGFDREGRANQTPTGNHMHPVAAGNNGPISHREAA